MCTTATGEEIVAILRSASSGRPDSCLECVLKHFTDRFRRIGRSRFPSLGDLVGDCAQNALEKLIAPQRLDQLKDPAAVEAWADMIFRRELLSEARRQNRDRAKRDGPGEQAGDEEHADVEDFLDRVRDLLQSALSPEELLALKELVEKVLAPIRTCPVATLKWIYELSDKEIGERLRLTPDQVRGRLKRMRQRIWKLLEDMLRDGNSGPTHGGGR